MKCQHLFSGKNKKNINFSSAELAQRVAKLETIRTALSKNRHRRGHFTILPLYLVSLSS